MSARKGPFFVYDAHEMPDKLRLAYLETTKGYPNGHMIFWRIGAPGGPFEDDVESYTEANYGSDIALHKAVDAWLVENGAAIGEMILLRHW